MTGKNTHFYHLLSLWIDRKDECLWVLGTIIRVKGSAYRKPGAFMLFNDAGERHGLLSGGCLEADLQRHARRVIQTGQDMTLRYDSTDEDELTFKLGLGCGGVVDILLQPISRKNRYLSLDALHTQLAARKAGTYQQIIKWESDTVASTHNSVLNISSAHENDASQSAPTGTLQGTLLETQHALSLTTTIPLPPHLLIVGGGIDAIPMAAMASALGWEVSLADSRPANARLEHFPSVSRIYKGALTELSKQDWFSSLDAAIIMAHSTNMDADGLKSLAASGIRYCGLLGPTHRKQQVIELANVTEAGFPCELHGPAGFDIGADLPEGIALSILSQCHSVLFGGNGTALG